MSYTSTSTKAQKAVFYVLVAMLVAILIQPVFVRDFIASKRAIDIGFAFAVLVTLGVAIIAYRLHQLQLWVAESSVALASPFKRASIWVVILAAYFGFSWLFFFQPVSRTFTQAFGAEASFTVAAAKVARSSRRGCRFSLRFVGTEHPFAFRQCLSSRQYSDLPAGEFVVRLHGNSSSLGTVVHSFTVER